MAKKNAAQRGQKKNEKALKRKKALARRKDPLLPEMRWKPLTEGVEGLARRMQLNTFQAASVAPAVLKALSAPPDAVWTADRMRGLSTGAVLEMLEALGVSVDAETFANRALDLLSTVQFVESDWLPALVDSTVHQRDQLRAANIVLWERWLPDTTHDEQIDQTVVYAGLCLDDPAAESPIVDLLDTYAALGDEPARRLLRHPNGEEFVRVLLDALWQAYENGQLNDGSVLPEDEEAALAALDLLVPVVVPSLLPELAPLREALAGDPEHDWDDDDDDRDELVNEPFEPGT